MTNKLATKVSSIKSPGYWLSDITKCSEHCALLSKLWQPSFYRLNRVPLAELSSQTEPPVCPLSGTLLVIAGPPWALTLWKKKHQCQQSDTPDDPPRFSLFLGWLTRHSLRRWCYILFPAARCFLVTASSLLLSASSAFLLSSFCSLYLHFGICSRFPPPSLALLFLRIFSGS